MGESTKLPKPLGSYVLLPNPLHGKLESMEKDLEKMPEKDRIDYLKKNVYDVCQNLEVLAKGEAVRELSVGDYIMTNPELIQQGIVVMEGEYVLLRESNIIAKW